MARAQKIMHPYQRLRGSQALAWLVLIHILLFALFWLTNSLFYQSVNDFLASTLSARLDYVSLCLALTGALGLLGLGIMLWRGPRDQR